MSAPHHTGRPDCPACMTAVAAAGGRAFREARAQARAMGLGRGAHVPGEHPVADFACEAADRAEAAVAVCFRPVGRQAAGAPPVDDLVLAHLPPADREPVSAEELAGAAGLARQRAADVLRRLAGEGRVERAGEGRKGAPYRYRQAPILSAKPGQERSGGARGIPRPPVSATAPERAAGGAS